MYVKYSAIIKRWIVTIRVSDGTRKYNVTETGTTLKEAYANTLLAILSK